MTTQKLKQVVRLSTIIVSVFVAVMVCIISYQCIKIGVLQRKSRNLDKMSANLSQQQAQLQKDIDIHSTDAYVQQTAREQYGMVKPGDTLYIS